MTLQLKILQSGDIRIGNMACECHMINIYYIHIIFFFYLSTRHTPGLEAPAEGPPLEEISFKLTNEVVLSGGTLVLCPIAGSLMASTEYGVIHRINWEGVFDKKLSIELSSVVFGNDLLPETRGVCVCMSINPFQFIHSFMIIHPRSFIYPFNHLSIHSSIYPFIHPFVHPFVHLSIHPSIHPLAQVLNEPDCVVDISYSLELHGLAVVLSSGRVAFLTGKTARFLPDVSTSCI